MKKLIFLVVLVALATVAFAADPVVPAAAPAVAAQGAVGFLDWFKQNSGAVLGFALAFSELLSLIPAFKGNGILDTIIKALQSLSTKPAE